VDQACLSKGAFVLKPFSRIALAAMGAALAVAAAAAPAMARPVDRIFVIMMENQSFDNVVGRHDAGSVTLEDTPFITALAQNNGLATLYFGVTHPSLPNYVGLIAGDVFGVHNDNASCYAVPKPTGHCVSFKNVPTLVDSLEAKGMTWSAYFQAMPTTGFLGVQFPSSVALYAQKHNPFVYFNTIAHNPGRLAQLKPIDQLKSDLARGASAPQFEFIVPDQCHDMHGQAPCSDFDPLLREGDKEVEALVTKIEASPAFTADSLIFVTFDEDDYSSTLGCCDSPSFPYGGLYGGGHTVTIVVSGTHAGPIASAVPYNEYSMLSTIENLWGLPLLGKTSDTANVRPMTDLIP
jgi:phospholipase C